MEFESRILTVNRSTTVSIVSIYNELLKDDCHLHICDVERRLSDVAEFFRKLVMHSVRCPLSIKMPQGDGILVSKGNDRIGMYVHMNLCRVVLVYPMTLQEKLGPHRTDAQIERWLVQNNYIAAQRNAVSETSDTFFNPHSW